MLAPGTCARLSAYTRPALLPTHSVLPPSKRLMFGDVSMSPRLTHAEFAVGHAAGLPTNWPVVVSSTHTLAPVPLVDRLVTYRRLRPESPPRMPLISPLLPGLPPAPAVNLPPTPPPARRPRDTLVVVPARPLCPAPP